MRKKRTSPARKKEFTVFAESSRLVSQTVWATGPEEAYAIASENKDAWDAAVGGEGGGDCLRPDVWDAAAAGFVSVPGLVAAHCESCGRAIARTGTVRSRGLNSIHITNDVGGTTSLPDGDYRVRVHECVYDYETGLNYTGELTKPQDIEIAQRAGTTGFKPRDYRKYGEKRYREKLKAAKSFDPKIVYFSEFNFIPDPVTDYRHAA